MFGCVEVIQKLLEYKVNIKTVIKYNKTALYIAARHEYIEVIQILLKYSTKVDA